VNDPPRRRRSDDDSDRSGGLPLFPLILIVIFAGLLLGGVLAHFFGGSAKAPKATPAPVAVLPTAIPTVAPPPVRPSASAHATPPATASPTPEVTASSSPSPGATPPASAEPSATPSPKPARTATPSPKPARTASPKPSPVPTLKVTLATPAKIVFTPKPAGSPAKAANATPASNYVSAAPDQAAGIVRSYLGALARGDRATATSYLANGLPGEVFMDSNARIVSVHSIGETASQYKVAADVLTSTGEYYLTFVLVPGPGGLQITDHYAIKVH
jgi:hypothetical protein